MLLFHGGTCPAIVIESDGAQTLWEGLHPHADEVKDLDSFVQAVADSGVVGLGGAGFPAAVKLKVEPGKVDYILIFYYIRSFFSFIIASLKIRIKALSFRI